MTFQVEEALAFPAWKGPLHAQHDRRHGPTPGTLHVKLPTSGAKRRPSKLPGGKAVPPRTSRMAREFSETAAKARKRTSPCRDWKEEFRARTLSRAAHRQKQRTKALEIPGNSSSILPLGKKVEAMPPPRQESKPRKKTKDTGNQGSTVRKAQGAGSMERNGREASQRHPQGDRPGTPPQKHTPHLLGGWGMGRECESQNGDRKAMLSSRWYIGNAQRKGTARQTGTTTLALGEEADTPHKPHWLRVKAALRGTGACGSPSQALFQRHRCRTLIKILTLPNKNTECSSFLSFYISLGGA